MSEIKVFAIHRDGKLQDAYPVMAKSYDDAVIDYTCECAITPKDAGIELVEYAPVNDWQPIETAPKDGTFILLYGDDCVYFGRWAGDEWDTGWGYVPVFTHWMSQPVPPDDTNNATQPTCVWTYDPQHCKYDGTCGVEWCFSEGTATENGVNYCPQCGDKVEVSE